jgi:hypothetical protein
MYVHALHTVHALPDLRVAGGRLGDGFLDIIAMPHSTKAPDCRSNRSISASLVFCATVFSFAVMSM